MKHRAKDSLDSDGVRIIIRNESQDLAIEVANIVDDAVAANFDFDESLASGGVGMGMVQSLMPPEGAELKYQQIESYVQATLILHPPVILNMYSSEINVLEAIS